MLLSLAILQFNLTSVGSIAILTGVVLCLVAGTEFTMTAVAPTWKAAHALLGIVFLAGGVTAFGWPGATFVVLARLFAWYLIPLGTFEIVDSLANRWELWWLRLLAGGRVDRNRLLGRAVAHSVCGAARVLGRDRRP